MGEILRYEHVDISFNGKAVVEDVSFTLDDGEILGIVGESGSGKSTVIRAAMGLLGHEGQVTRGDIYYRGMDLPDLSPAEMRKLNGPDLGMVFQSAGASFLAPFGAFLGMSNESTTLTTSGIVYRFSIVRHFLGHPSTHALHCMHCIL